MPVSGRDPFDASTDAELQEVLNDVLRPLRFDDGVKEHLLSPWLSVIRTAVPVASCWSTILPNHRRAILVGSELVPLIHHYTRVAAAYFSDDGQSRSQKRTWEAARNSLATALEWLALSSVKPEYPPFRLAPREEQKADLLAHHTLRFALSHELAHVVNDDMGRGRSSLRHVASVDKETLLANQSQELSADYSALAMVGSVSAADEVGVVCKSAIYFVNIVELRKYHLQLLAKVVEWESWKVSLAYPPDLERTRRLAQVAEAYGGIPQDLMNLNNQLQQMNAQVAIASRDRQEATKKAVDELVERETKARFEDQGSPTIGLRRPGCSPGSTAEVKRLCSSSPLGVVFALQHKVPARQLTQEEKDYLAVVQGLSRALPLGVRRFMRMSYADRARFLTTVED